MSRYSKPAKPSKLIKIEKEINVNVINNPQTNISVVKAYKSDVTVVQWNESYNVIDT